MFIVQDGPRADWRCCRPPRGRRGEGDPAPPGWRSSRASRPTDAAAFSPRLTGSRMCRMWRTRSPACRASPARRERLWAAAAVLRPAVGPPVLLTRGRHHQPCKPLGFLLLSFKGIVRAALHIYGLIKILFGFRCFWVNYLSPLHPQRIFKEVIFAWSSLELCMPTKI